MEHIITYPGIISDTAHIWKNELRYGHIRKFKKNDHFFFHDQDSTDFMFIISGSVSLNYNEINGKSKCQLICCSNTLINEANIITGLPLDRVDYVAIDDTEVIYYSSDKYTMNYIKTRPELLYSMAYSQSIKLIHAHILYNAISVRSKLQLICWYLLRLSESNEGSNSFVPDVTQAQMSLLLGINNRTFNRHITFLKEECIISCFTKRKLDITNKERLRLLSQPVD